MIQWPLPFTDDQSITFDVHYISLTYTALTGAISLTQTIRSVRQGTSPQYQKCYLNLVIWYWYRYLSAQPIISNSEAAMLSKIKGRLFSKYTELLRKSWRSAARASSLTPDQVNNRKGLQNLLSYSVNSEKHLGSTFVAVLGGVKPIQTTPNKFCDLVTYIKDTFCKKLGKIGQFCPQ